MPKVKLSDIPKEVINEYNLCKKATPDGWVYVHVNRRMYGLPQAGSIANALLETCLNQAGHCQSKITPGLWKDDT